MSIFHFLIGFVKKVRKCVGDATSKNDFSKNKILLLKKNRKKIGKNGGVKSLSLNGNFLPHFTPPSNYFIFCYFIKETNTLVTTIIFVMGQ
jgi:hypothetical protein